MFSHHGFELFFHCCGILVDPTGNPVTKHGYNNHCICISNVSRWFGGGMVASRWCWSGLELDMSPCLVTMVLNYFLTVVVS
jgi:hypothetical protein